MTLPNFLIIGGAKAGTTTLHAYLRAHPEIFMPARKELHFFAYDGEGDDLTFPVKTLADYESYFDGVQGETAVGEASPSYLRVPAAASRIREVIPEARLIVSLRDPADRSFSSYQMVVRNKGLDGVRSFEEALDRHAMLRRGYFKDLATYIDLFGRDRIAILLFDDLVRRPVEVAQRLYGFLGVATDFVPDVERVSNPGGVPKVRMLHSVLADWRIRDFGRRYLPERLVETARSVRNSNLEKQRITPAERRKAIEIFREDVLRTQELIGRDLSAWLDPRDPAPAPPRMSDGGVTGGG